MPGEQPRDKEQNPRRAVMPAEYRAKSPKRLDTRSRSLVRTSSTDSILYFALNTMALPVVYYALGGALFFFPVFPFSE